MTRVSKFPGLFPGEVARRLKAAVFGQRADNPDESDEDDDSPVDDTQISTRQDGRQQPGNVDGGNMHVVNGSPSINSPSRNYNTFGWDSDTERATSVTEAP